MTDVPRRSYPLVVPAPGGFEDAVRRGRRMRHRKAGSSAGAALALAGVLAYSVVSNGPGTTAGIDIADKPLPTTQPAPGLIATTPEPTPTASPTEARPPEGGGGQPVPGGSPTAAPGQQPTGPPGPGVAPPPNRDPGDPEPTQRPYERRNTIKESAQPELAGSTDCLPQDGKTWCAFARADQIPDTTHWDLVYRLCRAIDQGDGRVDFRRVQEAEYTVTDTRNQDTIWTWSAGQPVVPSSEYTIVPAGHCVSWTVRWNGYDDFGLTPRPGQYVLRAASTGTSDTNLPTDTEPLSIGG